MASASEIQIKRADIYEWDEAIELAWRTFLKFEAKDYSEEGIGNFRNFLTDALMRRKFLTGEYPVFIALLDGKQVGMASLRNNKHISLLFVDEAYHRLGIGRKLIESIEEHNRRECKERRITVNAAPYAVDFYHHLGFEDVAPRLCKDGIAYTPMEKRFG